MFTDVKSKELILFETRVASQEVRALRRIFRLLIPAYVPPQKFHAFASHDEYGTTNHLALAGDRCFAFTARVERSGVHGE